MIRSLTICAALLAGSAAIAQTTTIQQDFEAAARLDAGTDRAAAIAAWDRLEARVAMNKRSRAIVLVRKSAALMADGQRDAAVTAARAGLADLPASDPTLRSDRYSAHFNLGRVARESLDYPTAADEFSRAETLADTPEARFLAVYGVVDVQTFVDPAAAAASAERLDTIVSTMKLPDKTLAQYHGVKARLEMNRGDFARARSETLAAIRKLGGVTSKTDLNDVAARSDAAIAALLSGQEEDARRYMSMTGAGRVTKGSFDPGVQMRAPDCGGEADLKPADVAVVEFDIDDDGSVTRSMPVYAAGGGRVALEFARVARQWSWRPDQVKQLPYFFRRNVRIEMRCSTEFSRPSTATYMMDALAGWLESRGVARKLEAVRGDAAALPEQRAALREAEKHPDRPIELARALATVAINNVTPRDESGALATRARDILAANGAPAVALLPVEFAVRRARIAEFNDAAVVAQLQPLLTTKPYSDDVAARSIIRLYVAEAQRARSPANARIALEQIVGEQALAKNDPLRVGALIRIASLEQTKGNPAGARAAFEQSGLSANQCAIIDAPPQFLSAGGTFPTEAVRWGFEGWTVIGFDVSAEGKVLNERAILSYPPFVFTKAGAKTIAGAKYSKSYRPDGGLGCGGESQRVRFVMPG